MSAGTQGDAPTHGASARLDAIRVAYGAAQATLDAGPGASATVEGSGGGLAQGVERAGLRPALGALHDGETLHLRDPGCALELRRVGQTGTVRVTWADGPTYEDRLPVPLVEVPLPGGGALPVVDPVRPSAPVGVAARPLDRAAALADIDHAHEVFKGQLYPMGGAPGRPEGVVPAVPATALGSAAFCRAHGVRAAYVAGAMAGGIASAPLVIAMARQQLLAFFGAGGLPLTQVDAALAEIQAALPAGAPWGANLLHNPDEPAVEERTVDLYLKRGVPAISASAFMTLTPAVLRYRFGGLQPAPGGGVTGLRPVFAKVSRTEVAERFLAPPPASLLDVLVERGALTPEQAKLAATLPVAEDITAEADSGGHTDRRALMVLVPLFRDLRDRLVVTHGYAARGIHPRIGAAGGLGTPASVHAAFALGADYVLTGSINQSTVEAGTSDRVKTMLAEATMADVAQGPAPDMFELGAQVQVLSRGTMYAQRARRLYEVYREYDGLDDIPDALRAKLERSTLGRPIAEIWTETEAFWQAREPARAERARQDPKLKMALVFRWYLGMSSRWARTGEAGRARDYQIWCGPSMGAFNAWAEGGPLSQPQARRVADIAWALLTGAAQLEREAVAVRLGV